MIDNEELRTLAGHKAIKIGGALKWRGVYDPTMSYYTDNVVTMCGCVFWHRPEFTRNVPPVMKRVQGSNFYEFANTETWTCILDNLWVYNNCKDIQVMFDRVQYNINLLNNLIEEANNALGKYEEYIRNTVREELDSLRVGALDIQLYSSNGFLFRKGYTETVIYARIFCNGFDVTEKCTNLIHSYEWTRDSGNEADDKKWSEVAELMNDGLAVRIVDDTLTRHDLGLNFFTKRQKVRFTLKVRINIDGVENSVEAIKSLSFV